MNDDVLFTRLSGEADPARWAEEFAEAAAWHPRIATDKGRMALWFSRAILTGEMYGLNAAASVTAANARICARCMRMLALTSLLLAANIVILLLWR